MEAVSSVFQEEMNAPINLELLRQSLKSFMTFYKLYCDQKSKLMKDILEHEPKAVDKVRESAELGMINDQILWSKTFPKISKTKLR